MWWTLLYSARQKVHGYTFVQWSTEGEIIRLGEARSTLARARGVRVLRALRMRDRATLGGQLTRTSQSYRRQTEVNHITTTPTSLEIKIYNKRSMYKRHQL